MEWDDVSRADDYEVVVVSYDLATGVESYNNYVVTDPTFSTPLSAALDSESGVGMRTPLCAAARTTTDA